MGTWLRQKKLFGGLVKLQLRRLRSTKHWIEISGLHDEGGEETPHKVTCFVKNWD